MPSFKDVLQLAKTYAWKKAIKVEYKTLLANDTWILIDRPKHQYVFIGK